MTTFRTRAPRPRYRLIGGQIQVIYYFSGKRGVLSSAVSCARCGDHGGTLSAFPHLPTRRNRPSGLGRTWYGLLAPAKRRLRSSTAHSRAKPCRRRLQN